MSYLHAPLVHSVGMVERILVTGAGGYIGRHVVKALLDDGQDVIASDLRLNDVDDRAEHIETNLFESGNDIYSKLGKPDVCLHMAWRDGFKHNSAITWVIYPPIIDSSRTCWTEVFLK